jgi:hypothetical protein|tara:strand:+ start:164 stop:331 length:168 start_codon:yes stop_codon:yes gene_type:complete
MNDFNTSLKKCETLKQVFDLVNQVYNTDKGMGIFTGSLVKQKIPELIKVLNLKKR